MRICHVAPIYLPGIIPGCSKYIQDLSETLARRGHSVTVLTSLAVTGRGWVDPIWGAFSPTGEERIHGVRVKRLPTRWPVTATAYILREVIGSLLSKPLRHFVSLLSAGPFLSRLTEELRAERFDVIHVTALPFTIVWQVQRACRALKRPYICSPLIHFEDPKYDNPFLWKALEDAEGVIACSRYEKERILTRGISLPKVHVIPMGLQLGDWIEADGKGFRARHHLEGKKVVLFAGRRGYDKGAIHLLQAMETLSRKRGDLRLLSIGPATREWEKEKKRHQAYLLDLGYVSEQEKQEAVDACDLLAMPSKHDSFGIVYLEAWMRGKPVIGARVGAIPEVIEDRQDGLLVEFGNVDQLTRAIEALIDHPDRCREMGERGRKKVVERMNWQKNVERVEAIYQGVMAS